MLTTKLTVSIKAAAGAIVTEPTKVLIIGAGQMGGAIAAGLKRSNQDISITAIDPNPARREEMKMMGILALENLPTQIASSAIILAIPPQIFEALSKQSPQLLRYDGLIISVMAGIHTLDLSTQLNTNQICRAIPNIACALGESMTVLAHQSKLTVKNSALVDNIFSRLGRFLVIKDESLIDAATALVGGGPAYISYFTAALIEYAISAGFDEAQATSMVIQTLRGATSLIESSAAPPMTICEKVMTPDGTTVRAINFFNRLQLRTIIIDGLKHSRARSSELGGGA
ncbi:pyrroline-5-carboxylate reductase [Pseudomonas syringae]|uniref:pyrroline-5-carboxylate reductase n=1 Tax=Pseudomonas syringae TaxID=317 RepID=UPI001F169F23|nr:pyrroline-5-carboxylate reductase [Pseudomonas syringae]MCF5725179.1 pyrroline-5-carboxylate reductase [Pseudomonas syringae]